MKKRINPLALLCFLFIFLTYSDMCLAERRVEWKEGPGYKEKTIWENDRMYYQARWNIDTGETIFEHFFDIKGIASLSVYTVPEGALFFLDGKRVGSTPLSIAGLPAYKDMDISLKLAGYKPLDTVVNLEKDKNFELNINLEPSSSSGDIRRIYEKIPYATVIFLSSIIAFCFIYMIHCFRGKGSFLLLLFVLANIVLLILKFRLLGIGFSEIINKIPTKLEFLLKWIFVWEHVYPFVFIIIIPITYLIIRYRSRKDEAWGTGWVVFTLVFFLPAFLMSILTIPYFHSWVGF